MHLRDGSYRGAASLGHGQGYDYPHSHDEGWVSQQYRPSEVASRRYYEPTSWGFEARVTRRLQEIQDHQSTATPPVREG